MHGTYIKIQILRFVQVTFKALRRTECLQYVKNTTTFPRQKHARHEVGILVTFSFATELWTNGFVICADQAGRDVNTHSFFFTARVHSASVSSACCEKLPQKSDMPYARWVSYQLAYVSWYTCHTQPINFVFEDTNILSALCTVCFASHNTNHTVNIRHVSLYSCKSWARDSTGSAASVVEALHTDEYRAVAEW
jgi:hypothetical protein